MCVADFLIFVELGRDVLHFNFVLDELLYRLDNQLRVLDLKLKP